MRKPTDICLLCNENNSSQKNSHIIPKFFSRGIFNNTNPRHCIKFEKDGNIIEKAQDIAKEDFLFCSECEKGFSIFETYCSVRLERFNKLWYNKNFKRYNLGEFEYFEYNNFDIRIFNLFICSIIWRISIYKNFPFLKFNLSNQEEERLRILIKKFIAPSQTILIDRLCELSNLTNHGHIIIRPKINLKPPVTGITGSPINEWLFVVFLVDYIIIYTTDKNKLIGFIDENKYFDYFNEIDNNKLNGMVRVGLIDTDKWKTYNLDIFNKMRGR